MTRHGLSALLSALDQLSGDDQAVLATVIDTEGSSYRKAGARMLINLAQHQLTGIVGGGCFDDDLIEHAREVANSGLCKVAFYDMRADDDVLWGLGMGCNGAVRVLLQPISADHPMTELLKNLQQRGGQISLRLATGECWQSDPQSVPAGLSGQGQQECFSHRIAPRFRLGIFGTGSDVLPVLDMADQLDWHITLWDHRPGKVKAHRFPQVAAISAFDNATPADAQACQAVLVMSHNFDADRRFLNAIAGLGIPFIGSLGPISRRLRLLEQMERVPEGFADTLHGPVGLNLGGELPEEIALSVISQIQSWRLGCSALPLPQ